MDVTINKTSYSSTSSAFSSFSSPSSPSFASFTPSSHGRESARNRQASGTDSLSSSVIASTSWHSKNPPAKIADIKLGRVFMLPPLKNIHPKSVIRTQLLHPDAYDHPVVVTRKSGNIVEFFPSTTFRCKENGGKAAFDAKFPPGSPRRGSYVPIDSPELPTVGVSMQYPSYVCLERPYYAEVGTLLIFHNDRVKKEVEVTSAGVRYIRERAKELVEKRGARDWVAILKSNSWWTWSSINPDATTASEMVGVPLPHQPSSRRRPLSTTDGNGLRQMSSWRRGENEKNSTNTAPAAATPIASASVSCDKNWRISNTSWRKV